MKVEVQEDHSLTLKVRCQQDKAITLHKLKGDRTRPAARSKRGNAVAKQAQAQIVAQAPVPLLKANFARWLQTHTFSPANVASNGLGLFEPGSRGQTHVQSSQVDSNQCSILTFTILFYWHLF